MKYLYNSFIVTIIIIAGVTKTDAQTPVWSTDIAPIIYNHCSSCHHNGGIAPTPLMTFADMFSQGSKISYQVQSGKMPPWPPDPAYHRLAHERLLTTTEITKITDWVSGGKPSGNIALAPPQPTFNNNGDLPGTPDLIVKIPPFTSTANTSDVYQCFAIPSGLLQDHFIAAFEAVPGNRGIVHHVLVFEDTTGICAHLDSLYPGPGYPNFGGVGNNNVTMLGGWVPGSAPVAYPAGFGVMVHKGGVIVLQIHYPQGTAGMKDSTEVHLFFTPTNAVRNISIQPVLSHTFDMTNGPINIAPNTTKTYWEEYTSPPINISVLGVAPHMHLVGQNIEAFGVTPANDTQRYISIPQWDFHWQGFYLFRNFMKVPGGTKLYSRAFYDNTTNNPNNPNTPPQTIVAGEQTTNEMMITFFVFTPYQAGDENIKIDSSVLTGIQNTQNYYHGAQLFDPYPNPAADELIIKCYSEQNTTAHIQLIDITGKVARDIANERIYGYKTYEISVNNLQAGIYTLRMFTDNSVASKQIIIKTK